MRQINYDKEMQKIIKEHLEKGEKPRLLMHSCCAPCSTACIERVKDFFELSIYYYNPNMDSLEEYSLRLTEQEKYCLSLGLDCIKEDYDNESFLQAVKGKEHCHEGGERCAKCFYLRLKKTAEYAKQSGYDYFTTTLTVSPLKNASKLNQIGQEIEREVGVKFLPSDFKKNNGYLRSIELSKQNQMYRQNYCGCVFSKRAVPQGEQAEQENK